ncbi:hypothetical protein T265_00588 [Opisthorchis viverrini]|uniref:Uncharacterized protein n=1 Tax=Opisthorchis viverrini TaxID=6198 RepID=A0A075A279_OPIVI|nr:hypothetical protein T265_00588 [Opisthorchis viverrini]KER33471.1 hypothetical protein T265_00588 [Opisthorchis viverrini]
MGTCKKSCHVIQQHSNIMQYEQLNFLNEWLCENAPRKHAHKTECFRPSRHLGPSKALALTVRTATQQYQSCCSHATFPSNVKERKPSAVALFRCLAAMPPEGSTRVGILPGCPSLDRGSRVAEVGFEPRAFRSVNSRSNHLGHLAPFQCGNIFIQTFSPACIKQQFSQEKTFSRGDIYVLVPGRVEIHNHQLEQSTIGLVE